MIFAVLELGSDATIGVPGTLGGARADSRAIEDLKNIRELSVARVGGEVEVHGQPARRKAPGAGLRPLERDIRKAELLGQLIDESPAAERFAADH